VLDSAPAMSAYNAGIVPGMQIIGVNGSRFSLAGIEEAVRRTKGGGRLELTVANGSHLAAHTLDYHDGLKYPHLVRDASKPDLLRELAAPHAGAAAR